MLGISDTQDHSVYQKIPCAHRPADILRANGIMPPLPQLKRKASAEPTRQPSPHYDQADAEEERMLRERLNALEAKRLKTEKKPRVKNEPHVKDEPAIVDLTQGRKKKIKPAVVPGEIIDLTWRPPHSALTALSPNPCPTSSSPALRTAQPASASCSVSSPPASPSAP
ncbi:hypothetical protein K438DRAFT_1966185 [Mycena galopus ATCC 62051]|nr:hypothetical protein K438DRAFT_1966185 [Mycena galopus ATCC 62051]